MTTSERSLPGDAQESVSINIDDGVAQLTLSRPAAMNAVTTALAVALEQGLRTVGDREDVRVVLIRGAGGNFCAGGDFEEVQRLRSVGPEALRTLFVAFQAACLAIAEIAPPVVCAIEGVAMAGGFELMQASDIALVREDARISDNHVNFGMIPGGGSSQRLPRIVGSQRALGLLLSGDRISGADAVDLGLAYRAFPAGSFDDDVAAFVGKIAGRHPAAVRKIKRLVRNGLAVDLDRGLDLEIAAVIDHIIGDAGRTSVSAFAERKGTR